MNCACMPLGQASEDFFLFFSFLLYTHPRHDIQNRKSHNSSARAGEREEGGNNGACVFFVFSGFASRSCRKRVVCSSRFFRWLAGWLLPVCLLARFACLLLVLFFKPEEGRSGGEGRATTQHEP